MAAITGSNGELRYNGTRVAKCREFSLDISRDSLETTTLGSYSRTYIPGVRGSTGSATVIYDRDDGGTRNLLNSILSNSTEAGSVDFYLNTSDSTVLQVRAFVTQVSTPVSVGAVTACSVNFQVTGSIEGTF